MICRMIKYRDRIQAVKRQGVYREGVYREDTGTGESMPVSSFRKGEQTDGTV